MVALRHDKTPALVSCKISGRIGPAERTALLDAAEQAGARPVVVMRPRNGYVQMFSVLRGWDRLVPSEDPMHVPRPKAVVK